MNTDDVTFLSADNLSSCPNIRHAFYTRAGGVSGGIYASLNVGIGSQDDRNNVAENRRRAMAALDMPANALHTLYQVHGADVVRIDSGEAWQPGSAPQADAMVSSQPGAVLGVLTADCVPVLFADSSAGVVGAAHSGWKGTLVGVLEAAVDAMEALGADRRNIHASVGPAIAQASYEVGPEFPAPFLDSDSDNGRFFRPSMRVGHHMFDLTGCVVRLLERLNLSSIKHLGLDTCADDERFFSYRRATHRSEPDYGRGLSAICIAP